MLLEAELSSIGRVDADKLDELQIDQLHAATLKASDSCFEMKKLCATALVAVGSLIAVFSDKRVSDAVFIAGLAVIASFWLADSVGYYYQRKLRAKMGEIIARQAAADPGYAYDPPAAYNAFRSAFNGSMIYYLLLTTSVLAAWGSWAHWH